MLLGNKDCDYEMAYFLENGKYPPVVRNSRTSEVSIRDALEREWREPDMQYQLWRGCRFGSMDWIQ